MLVQPMTLLWKTVPLMGTVTFSLHVPWYQQAQAAEASYDRRTPVRT